MATRSEIGNTDSRLNAALGVAINDYSRRVDGLGLTAKSLANATIVQEAFQTRNRAEFVHQAKLVPGSAFYVDDQLIAGQAPLRLHVERTSSVFAENGALLGRIVVWL